VPGKEIIMWAGDKPILRLGTATDSSVVLRALDTAYSHGSVR